MALSELRGHFQIAVSLWVDATADPTFGVEQVRFSFNINFVLNINTVNFETKTFSVCSVRKVANDDGRRDVALFVGRMDLKSGRSLFTLAGIPSVLSLNSSFNK